MLERDHIRVQQAVATRVDLGPMLAVCGLAGGAGATTLAYLVALAAAEQDDGPVLVADTGGPSGGLAALAGVETSHSLVELAAHIAGHRPLEGGVYATGPSGVRVLATAPEFRTIGTHEQLVRLLLDAREAHRLTVIDCGTLARDADRIALVAATHVAWVLPATKNGISRGRRVLEAAPAVAARPLIVGRRDVVSVQGGTARAAVHRERAARAAGARPAPPRTRIPEAGSSGRDSAGAASGDPRSADAMSTQAALPSCEARTTAVLPAATTATGGSLAGSHGEDRGVDRGRADPRGPRHRPCRGHRGDCSGTASARVPVPRRPRRARRRGHGLRPQPPRAAGHRWRAAGGADALPRRPRSGAWAQSMDAPVCLRGRARRWRRGQRDGDRRELRGLRLEDGSRRAPARPDRARRLLARPRPLHPGPTPGAARPPHLRCHRAVDLPCSRRPPCSRRS